MSNNTNISEGTGIFWIFLRGLGIYTDNFVELSRVMLFPVFGHVLGIAMIFVPVYYFRQYLNTLPPETLHEDILGLLLCLVLMVVPGFIIFVKAFWEYMIAMVSLNTMVADIVKNTHLEDFNAHNSAVKGRTKDYVALLLLITGIWTMLLLFPFLFYSPDLFSDKPPTVFILALVGSVISFFILSVYLCLVYQVFAFEDLSPAKTINQSCSLIKNNFWRVLLLGIAVNIITNWLIPECTQAIAEIKPIRDILAIPFQSYFSMIGESSIVLNATPEMQARLINMPNEIAVFTVGIMATAFVLPLGSACFTLLYMDLKKRKND